MCFAEGCELSLGSNNSRSRVFGAREKWKDHQHWQLARLRGLMSPVPIHFMAPGVDEHRTQCHALY